MTIVSGASPWRTSSTASTTTRTLCDSKESVPNLDSSPDPVISRIRRDFERKQEFLRTTNLPNYLGSPTHPQQPVSASVQARTAPPPPHAGRCSICHFLDELSFIFVYKIKDTQSPLAATRREQPIEGTEGLYTKRANAFRKLYH